jgi:hypothetical protein
MGSVYTCILWCDGVAVIIRVWVHKAVVVSHLLCRLVVDTGLICDCLSCGDALVGSKECCLG